MSAFPVLAALGRCAACKTVAHPEVSMTIYQAAASVFAVLLLTGIAAEIREVRKRIVDPNSTLTGPEQTYLSLVFSLLFVITVGEFLSLVILTTGDPDWWQRTPMLICLALAVIGTPLLIGLSPWTHKMIPFEGLKKGLLVFLILLVIGAVTYMIYVALTEKPAVYTFHVYGTCAAGDCGLRERTEPSLEAEIVGGLNDGDKVEVLCQMPSSKPDEEVIAKDGSRSGIWDKLANGHYVSDLGVDTPPRGGGLPTCAGPTHSSGPTG